MFLNLTEDSPSLEKDGLTETQIRTDVEIRLRKAGIRVLTLEEVKELPRRPVLSVTLLASKSEALTKVFGESIYAFTIQTYVVLCHGIHNINGVSSGKSLVAANAG